MRRSNLSTKASPLGGVQTHMRLIRLCCGDPGGAPALPKPTSVPAGVHSQDATSLDLLSSLDRIRGFFPAPA